MKAEILTANETGTLASIRFLHFATHAIVDANRPYLSGLVLTPPFPTGATAQRGPAHRAGTGDDLGNGATRWTGDPATGWKFNTGRPELLDVGEIANLNLSTDLVVLSACRTLGTRSIPGDWLHGLTRAILVAGSSGVLCTTRETRDQNALSFVSALYDALLNEQDRSGHIDVARALQKVKCSFLSSSGYDHPSFWAPWVYYGRPGDRNR